MRHGRQTLQTLKSMAIFQFENFGSGVLNAGKVYSMQMVKKSLWWLITL